jgi:hypothetical protein
MRSLFYIFVALGTTLLIIIPSLVFVLKSRTIYIVSVLSFLIVLFALHFFGEPVAVFFLGAW